MLTRSQRDKWAEELESGKWKQGTGAMQPTHDTFCCLGVFTEVVGDPFALVVQWEKFVHMNDTEGLTFPEIAKHVRSLPVSDEPQP